MSYGKRRLAVFLAMVIAFTTVFIAIPQESAQAATKPTLYWSWGSSASEVRIAKGAKDLYVGDYVTAYGNSKYYGYLSMNSGVTYTSSKPAVASVGKKTGKLTAKKTGVTTITVKFKGKTIKQKVRVVSSLKSERSQFTNLSKQETAAQNFIKAYGDGKITTKNRYTILSKLGKFLEYGWNSGIAFNYSDGKYICAIYSPICGRMMAVRAEFAEYAETKTPFATGGSKAFKVKSISATGKKVTITLKSKVDAEQMFGVAYQKTLSDGMYAGKKDTYTNLRFSVYDSNYNYISGVAVVKKGSDKIVITLDKKLTKGKKYTVSCGVGAWLWDGKRTVTAK